MQKGNTPRLPASGAFRELLREKGQFWTPDWIARPMVDYVLGDGENQLFDPAVGAGAFFRAAKAIAKERGVPIGLAGMEIDSTALAQSLEYGLDADDLASVMIGDFILQSPETCLSAIVANPPYIRHHRLPQDQKEQLKRLGHRIIGKPLDGRAGLHIYFLIRALSLMKENGRLAFIMPADTCEGKFAHDLWSWILANFALDAAITFTPEASPFPNIDTNPLIFLIRKSTPKAKFWWVRCHCRETAALRDWVRSGFRKTLRNELLVIERDLHEGLAAGLSRDPASGTAPKYLLGDFVQVRRGVATGANEFFFMTAEKAMSLGIHDEYLVRAVGRTRDIVGEEITHDTLAMLEARERPTWLLSLNGDAIERYPESIQHYLQVGEMLGLPGKPLISQRKPWYKMESRIPPPFLFAYLGRRNSRFIRNTAKVIPLTGFLCVYPRESEPANLEQIWKIISHPDTAANLSRVGKTYGDGAIKVEPRLLERLPVPDHVVERCGLPIQMRLFEEKTPYEANKGHTGIDERPIDDR
jgi:hypothetical protein